MSVVSAVRCEAFNCEATHLHSAHLIGEARKAAAEIGWSVHRERGSAYDLCPDHEWWRPGMRDRRVATVKPGMLVYPGTPKLVWYPVLRVERGDVVFDMGNGEEGRISPVAGLHGFVYVWERDS